MEKGITLSKKHGVNPSVTHCVCCGKTYGVALLGRLKGDAEAPKDIAMGLCNDCEKVINSGGMFIIEVKDGETGNNPHRTGRIVGLSIDFKERNNIENPIMYMHQSEFSKYFENVEFEGKEDNE